MELPLHGMEWPQHGVTWQLLNQACMASFLLRMHADSYTAGFTFRKLAKDGPLRRSIMVLATMVAIFVCGAYRNISQPDDAPVYAPDYRHIAAGSELLHRVVSGQLGSSASPTFPHVAPTPVLDYCGIRNTAQGVWAMQHG